MTLGGEVVSETSSRSSLLSEATQPTCHRRVRQLRTEAATLRHEIRHDTLRSPRTDRHRKDHDDSFQKLALSEHVKPPRRPFSTEFKQDAVDLVVRQEYSLKAPSDAVGVSSRRLREWHEKLAPEPQPCNEDASIHPLREENKQLKKSLPRAEMERDVLKKPQPATARHGLLEAPAELRKGIPGSVEDAGSTPGLKTVCDTGRLLNNSF